MTVTVYSKDNCPGCNQLKARLQQRGIGYAEKNISHDPQLLEWLLAQGHRSVPVVYNGSMHVQDVESIFN